MPKIQKKMKKVWLKLLRAWTRDKHKKAVKLQHELLQMELEKNRKSKQRSQP